MKKRRCLIPVLLFIAALGGVCSASELAKSEYEVARLYITILSHKNPDRNSAAAVTLFGRIRFHILKWETTLPEIDYYTTWDYERDVPDEDFLSMHSELLKEFYKRYTDGRLPSGKRGPGIDGVLDLLRGDGWKLVPQGTYTKESQEKQPQDSFNLESIYAFERFREQWRTKGVRP